MTERKVFISFLGITDYTEVEYFYNDKIIKTPFAPVASLSFFKSEFSDNAEILFFVTEKANIINGEKLRKECQKQGISEPKFIPIENETKQENIWKNFTTIFSYLQKNDFIYFDITYGFRAVPMLFMVLINYAKFLRNIKVKKILYGAFDVKNEYDGKVPIWDLTNFAVLQGWSESANNFINSGNSTELSKLIIESRKDGNNYFQEFSDKLNEFTLSFNTCRGKNIFESDILNDLIEKTKLIESDLFPPLIPIIQELNEKMKKFDLSENILNGFKAVEWCIKNNLTQQGITLLQESLKAFIAEENGLDYRIYENMEIVGAAFYHQLKPWVKVKQNLKDFEDDIFKIKDTMNVRLLASFYEELRKLRNDINHAGLSYDARKGTEFQSALVNYYSQIKLQLNIK